MPAPATNDDFLELVRKSNQIDTGRLSACLDLHREGDTLPPDPKKLAALLVREGLLTSFQAEQFLAGRWRGFNLGGYRILERVASGGSGTVFLGEHEVMKRRVAVKILPPSFAKDVSVLERFRREAQAAAALDHPNIVRAYDFRQEGQTHFLVMEYVNGPSLQQVLESEGPMSVPVACEYIRQAAIGLQHAHETGMVHRDIKPGNLLVDPSGVLKILDMGLARFMPEGQDSLTKQYDEHTVMGTADYLSPEQALSLHNVDARADVYSLGATLYALLAGEAPFASGTVTQKLLWHQMRDPTPLDERRPEVPAEVADIVARMMSKDIKQRYQTCAEIAEALEPFSANTPTPQGPARPGQSTGPGSVSYVKGNGSSSTGSSVRLTAYDSARRKTDSTRRKTAHTPVPEPREPVSDRPSSRRREERRERDYDDRDDDRPRRRRDVDVSRAPADSGSLAGILMLVGVMGGLLLIVGGVIAFLVFGSAPNATSQSAGEGGLKKSVEKPKGANVAMAREDQEIELFGDTQGLVSVYFVLDGVSLLTGGKDRMIRKWDLEKKSETLRIPGHEGEVYSVRLGSSTTKVLSASADGTARVWQLPRGNEVRSLRAGMGKVNCAIFWRNENEVITAGEDGVIRLWQVDNGQVVNEMKGHSGPIAAIALNHLALNHLLVSAGHDKTLKVWDLNTGKHVRTLEGHRGPCTSVAVGGGNGTPLTAVSGSQDGTVRVWDVIAGNAMHTFSPNQGAVHAVTISLDGLRAASGGADKKVSVWNLQSKANEHTFAGHMDAVTGVWFSPSGKGVASCSLDRTLRVWPLVAK